MAENSHHLNEELLSVQRPAYSSLTKTTNEAASASELLLKHWEMVHKSDPTSLVTQSHAWIKFLCESSNYLDASRLYHFKDSGRKILLPLLHRQGFAGLGKEVCSIPKSWGGGGFLSASTPSDIEMQVIWQDLLSLKVSNVRVIPNPTQVHFPKGLNILKLSSFDFGK